MKSITLKIHPASSKNEVLVSSNSGLDFEIYTTSPAIDNKANLSLIKLLSKYLKIPKSKLIITKGEKNKIKTILLLD